MTGSIEILRPGPLTTVQDGGRRGHRHLGVGPSGAADRGSMVRANRLVGNPPDAAVIEVTLGGLVLRARSAVRIAVTGADCPGALRDTAVDLAPGDLLRLGTATHGLRAYVAFAGGLEAEAVLGSRSTDTLAGLGPPPLVAGQVLRVAAGSGVAGSTPPPAPLPDREVTLALLPGPRAEWLDAAAWRSLETGVWRVGPASNRTALRLEGPALPVDSLAIDPEPLVRGAVQVPPNGLPIVFLADHPVTGGYPIVAVLTAAAADLAAQCRPGTAVRLRSVDGDDDRAALAGG